jgi:acyl-CoA thioester hydrolase
MGVAHHASYPVWLEMGRTELLRDSGVSYRAFEAKSLYLVVVKLEVQYRQPARYDDTLVLETTLESGGPVKIVHTYVLRRDDAVIATAKTTLACVDAAGRPQAAPAWIADGDGTDS